MSVPRGADRERRGQGHDEKRCHSGDRAECLKRDFPQKSYWTCRLGLSIPRDAYDVNLHRGECWSEGKPVAMGLGSMVGPTHGTGRYAHRSSRSKRFDLGPSGFRDRFLLSLGSGFFHRVDDAGSSGKQFGIGFLFVSVFEEPCDLFPERRRVSQICEGHQILLPSITGKTTRHVLGFAFGEC